MEITFQKVLAAAQKEFYASMEGEINPVSVMTASAYNAVNQP